ncbi:UTP-glucose-1-phosphate uridylyltransferase [Desulfurobacterium thermolithotrophum DSM 11699]|uniref:UTP--glucose-1-phosphate uridylyltransferase n=1 Tax=Desulfurobacterium thermolithotrophum (strain DSM 11699 / BSA) TaxID=868864 RepID=F0S1N2_DESTD|nr:UTP--glucose-1-phosphate uridylyltransferase GalU [Desulfurobacterium thermolithotrophum]ADY74035.1 UTP-glucose-1-phosphate uridylyltransferase [Desulfurobacterium thermolithotrophum DSM 11699]
MIKKAVIPVAGLGTRFLPATKAQPKEMLPIVDKPVIQYIVEEAVRAGIKQIVFVTGKHKRAIEDHFDTNFELEYTLEKKGKEELLKLVREVTNLAEIVYIRQKEPLGLGHAILTAEPAIGNEPFAVLLGDDIMISNPPAIKQLMNVFDKYRCTVLGVQEVSEKDVSKYGIIGGKEIETSVFKVDTLVEKPSLEEAPSNLAITGRYILTPAIFDALKKTPPGKGGEIQLTDGIERLGMKEALYAKVMEGERYDTGSKLGFLIATVDFALRRKDLREPFLEFLREKIKEEKDNG